MAWLDLSAEVRGVFSEFREEQEYLYLLGLERCRVSERERDQDWEKVARQKALALVGKVKQSESRCPCGARLEYREGLTKPLHFGSNGQKVRCTKAAKAA